MDEVKKYWVDSERLPDGMLLETAGEIERQRQAGSVSAASGGQRIGGGRRVTSVPDRVAGW